MGKLPTYLQTLVHYKRSNPLAFRVLVSVLVFSSIITLLATGLQLYTNFQKDVNYIEKRVLQIRAGYEQSLSLGVWDLDRNQLYKLLNGIYTLPDIQYLEIRDMDGKPYISLGEKNEKNGITNTFPLTFVDSRNTHHPVGEFEISASLSGVYKRLRDSVLQILITQSIKTFLVSIFILLVIRHYITRHLAVIAQNVTKNSPDIAQPPISLPRKPSTRPDELDHLVAALNTMRAELLQHLHAGVEREGKLTRARNYVRQIIDLMPSVIIGIDRSGRISQWNREAEQVVGLSAAETLGKELSRISTGIGSDLVRILESARQGETLNTPRVKIDTGREMKFFDVTSYPLSMDQQEGVVVRMDHITERLKVEEMMIQNEKMVSVGLLAAGVAHEINNPVNSIINLAEIQKEGCEEGSASFDIAERISTEGTRIAGIVHSLLAFSRRDVNTRRDADFHSILLETLVLMQTQLKKDGIHVMNEIPEELPVVSCYMQQIQQVFLNILANAQYALNMKFPAEDPGKILRITAERTRQADRNGVSIRFRDSGIGIPAELLDDVKDPFFSTKPPEVGTGLGISISSEIIAQHQGTLDIVSKENEYTEVTVWLPIEERE